MKLIHAARLTVLAQWARTMSVQNASIPATSSDFFTASASYGYSWTRELRSDLSYTYRQRNDDTGVVRSSTILVRLSRDFSVYGKPPPEVQKTPGQAAQEIQQRAEQALPTIVPQIPINPAAGPDTTVVPPYQ